ncbi:mechanosensitive ion channel protein MscS [Gynuella sp.]|uniref:mechanosensitive ion channel protein MscS n=1 Tax=Gynuella sp. TaxID=2969146 RepID=UPI003D11B4B1
MSSNKWGLLWPMLLTFILTLVTAWFKYPTNHLPPGFGVFPPIQIGTTPGFNLIYFIVIAIGALAVTLFILFPTLFGFQKPASSGSPSGSRKLPWWFFLGFIVMVFFWWLMWSNSFVFGNLVYYAFTPMWWGFIIAVDGIVYYRNNGHSILSTRPTLMIISAIFSVFGWSYFEYFDYFVLSNWYYPNGHMSELSHMTIVIIFLAAYSTVWPAVFEWYTLLNSFPGLMQRYANGPKLPINGTWLLLAGSVISVAVVWLPYPMFWGIWIGPMAIICGQLLRLNIWNPLTDIANGNWSPAVLIALASMANGFFWEMWNYGSSHPVPLEPTNPNYWIYDIPYVNVLHFFSEMPLLGYFGYLPFGLFVWIMYIWAGKLFGFRTDLTL